MRCNICEREVNTHRHLCAICFEVNQESPCLLQECKRDCGPTIITDPEWTDLFLETLLSEREHLARFSQFVLDYRITALNFRTLEFEDLREEIEEIRQFPATFYAWLEKLHRRMQPEIQESDKIHKSVPVVARKKRQPRKAPRKDKEGWIRKRDASPK